jgi:hypothetical protein
MCVTATAGRRAHDVETWGEYDLLVQATRAITRQHDGMN